MSFVLPLRGSAVVFLAMFAFTAAIPAGAQQWQIRSSAKGDLPSPGPKDHTGSAIFDIDGDKVNDFVITSRGFQHKWSLPGTTSAECIVWYRRGGSGWTRYVIARDPIGSGGVLGPSPAADIDGDGDLDLPAMLGESLAWYENPSPDFDPDRPWACRLIAPLSDGYCHDLIPGDFDADGKPELIYWHQAKQANRLLVADFPADPTKSPWPSQEIYSSPGGKNKQEGIDCGDIDGDGQIDLVAAGQWFKHQGGTQYAAHWIDRAQTGSRIAVGELNKDNRGPEVVMVPGDTDGRLKWYECAGDPADEKAWTGHDLLGADVIHGHTLDVADFDGDGHLDVFCGEMAQWTNKVDNPQARVWIFYGDGRGHFKPRVISTGQGIHESYVADLDGDGDIDILFKPFRHNTPRVEAWLNRSGE